MHAQHVGDGSPLVFGRERAHRASGGDGSEPQTTSGRLKVEHIAPGTGETRQDPENIRALGASPEITLFQVKKKESRNPSRRVAEAAASSPVKHQLFRSVRKKGAAAASRNSHSLCMAQVGCPRLSGHIIMRLMT